MNASVQLDRYRQAAPQLYEMLRDMIMTIALPPGTPLMRSELAARFGVSQTPVRDALMRLQEEDLVDVIPQAATRVSKINMLHANQAHFLRRAIELEIVGQLASRPDRALAETLRTMLQEQQRLADAENTAAFSSADHAFHRALYVAAGVTDLAHLVRSRSGHIDRLRRLHLPSPGKTQRVLADHRLIVDAIEAGRADLAQQRLREHLSGTLSQVAEIRGRHPEYFMDDFLTG
jgi:DNA-binding GntR family transcriptional regulator